MKMLKYLLFIFVLIASIFFIIKLQQLNTVDNVPLLIKFPYIDSFEEGVEVWQAIILTLTVGVLLGFIIAVFQIISQKTEIISLKSEIRRLKNELDGLRNQSLEDEIVLEDSSDLKDEL